MWDQEKYLRDCTAVDIRNFLMEYDYKKDDEGYAECFPYEIVDELKVEFGI